LAASEVTRTVALVRALGAESSRLRHRFGASAIAGFAVAASLALIPNQAASQTPSTNPAGAGSDLLQPSLQGNPATTQRFRKPGQRRPSAEEPPPTNTFAPNRIGATPIYGSPSGLGAADTGFESLNVPRSKRKKTPLPPPRTIVPEQPETTFTRVPTYNPASAPPPAPQQLKPPPPEVYPLRAAQRVGATLPPPPPPLQEVPVNNPPPEIHPLAAANRPGSSLQVPGPEFYTYAVSSYLPDYVGNPPPPNLQPPNTFALGQRPQRFPIPTRRSASARVRSYCFPRSIFRARPAPIPNTCPAVRRPLMLSRRRNSSCARTGSVIR
jgi:hypothetical protein